MDAGSRPCHCAKRVIMSCAATVSWLMRAAVACDSHDHAAVIVHQIVVVVPQPSRRAALGGVGGIGIGGRYLLLLMHRFFHRVLLVPVPPDTGARCDCTWAASANCSRGMRLSFAALASTKLPSTDRCSPCTNPTSTHCATICSNNCSNSFDS